MGKIMLVKGFNKMAIKFQIRKNSVLIFILFIFSCNDYMYNEDDLGSLLGVKAVIESRLYSYEEISGIQGEGYLFNKYTLTDETTSSFISLNAKNSFPKKDEYKLNWKCITWKKGYMLNDNILDLLKVFEQHSNKELKKEVNELKLNLNNPDNFYSLFFKDSIEDPYAIELLVFNPKNKEFWVVNIVT